MPNTASPEPVTAPLRAEHRELAPFITGLCTAADAVGIIPEAELTDRVNAALAFLTQHLAAHAAAEEAALYPVVDRLLGGVPVTATMSRDHVEISRLTAELGAAQHRLSSEGLTDAVARDLRRLLYGLYAVVTLHFTKEEEVYLPILDARLSADDAAAMFADLARAASAHGRPLASTVPASRRRAHPPPGAAAGPTPRLPQLLHHAGVREPTADRSGTQRRP